MNLKAIRRIRRRIESFIQNRAILFLFIIAMAGIVAAGVAQTPHPAGFDPDDYNTLNVTFDTELGYGYHLYTSEDLVNWILVDPSFYGFGGEYSVHVHTVPEPGDPPPNQAPPPPSFQPLINEFAVNGKSLLSFTGDDGLPYQVLLDRLFSDIDITGSYFDVPSGYQFNWFRLPSTDYLPEYEGLTLSSLPSIEQAKVTAFDLAYDDIVAGSTSGLSG